MGSALNLCKRIWFRLELHNSQGSCGDSGNSPEPEPEYLGSSHGSTKTWTSSYASWTFIFCLHWESQRQLSTTWRAIVMEKEQACYLSSTRVKRTGNYRVITVAEESKELSYDQAAQTLELAAFWSWHSLSLKLKNDLQNGNTGPFLKTILCHIGANGLTMLCWFHMYSKVVQFYIYIYLFFFNSFPIEVITEYWAEFPVLYNRSFLAVCFKYGSVYMSFPTPNLSLLPPVHLHNQVCSLYRWVCFSFANKFICIIFFIFHI